MTIFVDKRKRVYIPTAFSPDGDGLNDVIMIYAARDVERIKVWRIFDRWGELVFEREDFPANDPAFGWDGQWRNALQQKRKQEDRLTLMNAQVFVYYAEVEFIDGETVQFKGDFTLMK
jgi:gliding motility-associated-like protein